MPNPLISIRPSGQLGIEIGNRAVEGVSVSEVGRRDLSRYYEALKRSLPTFTEAEATLIVNALNGARHADPPSISYIWAEIADNHSETVLASNDSLDGVEFTQRLRKLSYIECAAIVDAVERFWAGPYPQEGPIGPRLREVGLVK